jgi:hypothetical protein
LCALLESLRPHEKAPFSAIFGGHIAPHHVAAPAHQESERLLNRHAKLGSLAGYLRKEVKVLCVALLQRKHPPPQVNFRNAIP